MISQYWGNKVLNFLLNDSTGNEPPPGQFVALHSSDPGVVGNPATEIAGGSYERLQCYFTTGNGKDSTNRTVLKWTNMPYVVVLYVAVWSHKNAGNMIVYAKLPEPLTISIGQSFTINKYDLTFKM